MRFAAVLSTFALILGTAAGSALADDTFSTLAGVSADVLTVEEMESVVGATGGLQVYPERGVKSGNAYNGEVIGSYVNNRGTNTADNRASYRASGPGNTTLGD
jgi:hypothetical protein